MIYRLLYEDEESMSLVIKNVQSEDAGKYTFIAENELGSDTAEMNLTVKGKENKNSARKFRVKYTFMYTIYRDISKQFTTLYKLFLIHPHFYSTKNKRVL